MSPTKPPETASAAALRAIFPWRKYRGSFEKDKKFLSNIFKQISKRSPLLSSEAYFAARWSLVERFRGRKIDPGSTEELTMK